MLKKVFPVALILGCILVVGISIKQLEHRQSLEQQIESFLYLPQGKYATLLALGQEELVADSILIKGTVYFGEHYREYVQGHYQYEWLYHIFDVVTDFDPWYYDAYEMGAHLLDNPQQAIALYQKARPYFPEDYKLLEAIGFVYFYDLHDKGEAAKYYSLASQMPGHPPPYIASLADKFYREAGADYYLPAIEVLRKAAAQTDREGVRAEFIHRAEELETVLQLQRQVEVFKTLQKRLPVSFNELFLFGLSPCFLRSILIFPVSIYRRDISS